MGVLAALKRSERAFSEDDVAFLEQVARQVAIAVENALDYENASRTEIKRRNKDSISRRKFGLSLAEIVGESPALKTALEPGVRRGADGFERAGPGRDGNR